MSKKHHNYTNYSNPQQEPPVEPEVETVVEPVTNDKIIGVVTECVKLNVRKEPSLDAEILTEILIGTEVQVDISESTADFYKICTEAGVEGYCMRDHINVNA